VARFCTSSISNSARRNFMNGVDAEDHVERKLLLQALAFRAHPPQPQPREFRHQRVNAQGWKETDQEGDGDHRMRTQRGEDLAVPYCGDREDGEQYVADRLEERDRREIE